MSRQADGVRKLISGLFLLSMLAEGIAQTPYPDRPVRLIVPLAPGGAADLVARITGQNLSTIWAKPVTVENMPGAGTTIGAAHVAKATPDGYTLLFTGDAAMTTNVTLYPDLPYSPLRDFAPITMLVISPNVLVVHPSVPARSVQQLVALAKSQPGKITYASVGSGTSQHLAGELLKYAAGIEITHVPYKGNPMNDVLSGRVSMTFSSIVLTMPHVRDGKLHALGVSSARRWPAIAELPTIAESGYPGFEAIAWFGLVAPAKTPFSVVQKVHDDAKKFLGIAEVRSKFQEAGLEIVGTNPQEFELRIRQEIASKGKLVRDSGAKPN